MPERKRIILAAKCAPVKKILSDIERAKIEAVELFLSEEILANPKKIIALCKHLPFRFALHAPKDGFNPQRLADLAHALKAEIVVFHDIYWEDEWRDILKVFRHVKAKPCVENIYNCQAPSKVIRRYGLGMCLDLEHLQIEGAGFFEEEFVPLIKRASHIHLTGYRYGSELWHTPMHFSPRHALYLLGLLKKTGYSGFVVSEAKVSFQNYEQFRKLKVFFDSFNSKKK